MRVLNINKFFFMNGGVERYFFALTKLLEENGHDVIHFSMEDERNYDSKFSRYFVPNIDLRKPGLKLLQKAVRPIWYKQAQENLERLLDRYQPDIAHIHNLYHQLSPSILPILKKRGIPVVMTLHDYKLICPNYLLFTEGDVCKRCKGHKYYNAILHKCHKDSFAVSTYGAMEMTIHKLMQVYEKNVDVMIAPSKFVRDTFVEFGQSPSQIITIPHFVDPAFLAKAKSVRAYQSRRPYMLYFGRLAEEKGVDKILEMLYIYKPGIDLKLAGSGPLEEDLKSDIQKKNLENIEFLGHLEADELISYIKGAKLVIMPSRFYEPFGFAALETMALGTPLVVSQSGALAEFIPNELGRLFPRDDLREMAKAIEEVKRWDRKQLELEASMLIDKLYLPQKHYQTLLTVYEHLVR